MLLRLRPLTGDLASALHAYRFVSLFPGPLPATPVNVEAAEKALARPER